jgi:hypothetical protein
MWGLLAFMVLGLAASGAMAQPADCPARPALGPSLPLAIELAGRPGVPAGMTGKAFVEVQTPKPPQMERGETECGEQPAPTDVLGGAPGDLLHGQPSPAQTGR